MGAEVRNPQERQMSTLREKLIGAWSLVSYAETDPKTGQTDHPMGEHPEGLIMYTPDGYVSAQLGSADRRPFEGGDMYAGRPEEYTAAGSSYIAYSGPFFVDEAKGALQHEMRVSLFPNWKGQRQVRVVKIEGDTLHLSTDAPQEFSGAAKTASLFWRRAAANA
jgi:Lipocalin-like domain